MVKKEVVYKIGRKLANESIDNEINYFEDYIKEMKEHQIFIHDICPETVCLDLLKSAKNLMNQILLEGE